MDTKSTKNKADLLKELEEKALTLRDIRFGQSGSKTKNVKEYKNIKREIARIRTELTRMN